MDGCHSHLLYLSAPLTVNFIRLYLLPILKSPNMSYVFNFHYGLSSASFDAYHILPWLCDDCHSNLTPDGISRVHTKFKHPERADLLKLARQYSGSHTPST